MQWVGDRERREGGGKLDGLQHRQQPRYGGLGLRLDLTLTLGSGSRLGFAVGEGREVTFTFADLPQKRDC